MAENAGRALEDNADHEIVLTRLVHASRELVFEAWTGPSMSGSGGGLDGSWLAPPHTCRA
jgi:hypothetical protein